MPQADETTRQGFLEDLLAGASMPNAMVDGDLDAVRLPDLECSLLDQQRRALQGGGPLPAQRLRTRAEMVERREEADEGQSLGLPDAGRRRLSRLADGGIVGSQQNGCCDSNEDDGGRGR